jgi:hypothetical protein
VADADGSGDEEVFEAEYFEVRHAFGVRPRIKVGAKVIGKSASGSDPTLGAEGGDFAVGAVRFAGGAAAAAMPDEEMGEEGPDRFGNDFDEGLLHLDGIVLAGEAHPAGESTHMGVHDDALGEVEGVAEDHVGGFSSHAG